MICPKCRNENADAADFCGVCYEVLRKKPVAAPAPAPVPAAAALEPEAAPAPGWPAAVAVILLFAVLAALREKIREAFWVLDFANLAFHEGGHMIFGVLGLGNRWIMVAGGTAMQLLIPALAGAQLYKRGSRSGACLCAAWLGQNLLNVGHYVADARAQQLELVAGGVHDWTYLLETMGLLIHDEGLGRAIKFLGCLVIAASLTGAFLWRADLKSAVSRGILAE